MKEIHSEDLEWHFIRKEKINLGENPELKFNELDIIHAKIKPKDTIAVKKMAKNEIYCFFRGGNLKIIHKDGEEKYKTAEVFYIIVDDSVKTVENLSKKELEFIIIRFPPAD